RKYRELIVTTPGLNESIGGAILFDETIHQKTNTGIPLIEVLKNAGIIPGIKVDMGTKALAHFQDEKITEGLDGLRERLIEYKNLGARFAKWRAVIKIGNNIPTRACIDANAYILSRYAALCQEEDIVPIVEPEVLMDGDHDLQKCYDVTEEVLKQVFHHLYKYKVDLEGIILKPNMVLAGKKCKVQNSVNEVAEATINCFLNAVPASVPAIAFLSGGQSSMDATLHLNAIHKNFKNQLPWIVSFSFSRAIQLPALKVWKGEDANVQEAQKLLYHYAKNNKEARMGKFNLELTKQ
ncbi:MAG TPA: class I fructose-bisphosphate aldolase, partial [Chitinophagales bacterium]|nr:class I fructose-bisphosphate aldolase [Chitinophagales bacterium]